MKSLIFASFLAICLVTIYSPTVHSQTTAAMNTTRDCQLYNGTNCTSCLGFSRMCYWCATGPNGGSCLEVDFQGLISTTCPVTELFGGDCVLTGLYIIIIVVGVVLLVLGVILCMCVMMCVCCCWCRAKKRNFDDDKQRFNMGRITEAKDAKKVEREQKRNEIRNKYF